MDRLRTLDPFALAAVVITAVMIWAYVEIIHSQGDEPLVWVMVVLGIGAALAVYGAAPTVRFRPAALLAGAGLLGLMGLLAIFSIGLPILLAAALVMVAFLRALTSGQRDRQAPRDRVA